MLRRALVLTTAMVAIFFLARWAFFGGEDVAGVEPQPAGTVAEAPPAGEGVPPQTAAEAGAATLNTPATPADTAREAPAAAVTPTTPSTATVAPVPGAEMRLAGHRAVYDLVLGRNRNGSGVAAVDGRMVIEFADVCDGYTMTQQLRMRLGDGEGGYTTTDFRVVNWESRDGKRFRFSTRHVVNGEEDEVFEGTAELKDGAGEVHYTKPEERTDTLLPGTLFPTMHTVELLRAAQDGKHMLTRTLFDGSSDDIASQVVGAIGRAGVTDPGRLKGKGASLLLGKPSWPVRLAFFGIDNNEELPEFEIGFRLYDNGISGDIEMAYGDFSIDAMLSQIEAMPKPDC